MALDTGVPSIDLRADARAAQTRGNDTSAETLESVAKAYEDTVADGTFDVSPFVSGALDAMEKVKGASFLQYPADLGSNSRYRYAMRMLIFTQQKAPQEGVIREANSFDTSKRASQTNRINFDVITRSGGAAAVVGGASLVGKVVSNIASVGKNPVTQAASNLLSGLGKAAVAGAEYYSAYDTAKTLQNNKAGGTLNTDVKAYINLFMPDGLNFTDRHDYDSVSVTDALGTLGIVSQGAGTEIFGRIGEKASIAGFNLLGQNITELALYNSGYALNPQLEVLFKQTKNREFVFTFKFAPRNSDEASALNSIIRTLRYHASTNFASRKEGVQNIDAGFEGSRYIIPPSQFEIEFLVIENNTAKYNTKLPRLAPCVLTNIDVNYAPGGQFSAYYDGNPTEIQLQLTFTETVILTKSDVKVGY